MKAKTSALNKTGKQHALILALSVSLMGTGLFLTLATGYPSYSLGHFASLFLLILLGLSILTFKNKLTAQIALGVLLLYLIINLYSARTMIMHSPLNIIWLLIQPRNSLLLANLILAIYVIPRIDGRSFSTPVGITKGTIAALALGLAVLIVSVYITIPTAFEY